jgi:hypothetical protein
LVFLDSMTPLPPAVLPQDEDLAEARAALREQKDAQYEEWKQVADLQRDAAAAIDFEISILKMEVQGLETQVRRGRGGEGSGSSSSIRVVVKVNIVTAALDFEISILKMEVQGLGTQVRRGR